MNINELAEELIKNDWNDCDGQTEPRALMLIALYLKKILDCLDKGK